LGTQNGETFTEFRKRFELRPLDFRESSIRVSIHQVLQKRIGLLGKAKIRQRFNKIERGLHRCHAYLQGLNELYVTHRSLPAEI